MFLDFLHGGAMKFSILRNKVAVFAATLLAFTMFASGVFAQVGTSGVSGTVTDPQGQAVVGDRNAGQRRTGRTPFSYLG